MTATPQDRNNSTPIESSRASAIIIIATFLLSWATLAFFLGYLHWLNAFYLALIMTPLLAVIGIRTQTIKRRGWKRLPLREACRLYLGATAIWFSLVVLIYTVELWRGQWGYTRLVEAEQAKGNSFDPATLAPAPIPDPINFCATPLLHALVSGNAESTLLHRDYQDLDESEELSRMLTLRLPDRRFRPRKYWFQNEFIDLASWSRSLAQDPERDEPGTAEGAAAQQVQIELEKFTPIINELLAAAQSRPRSRWNINHQRGWYVEFLAAQRSQTLPTLIQILTLRAASFLQLGDSEAAFHETSLGLRLVDTLQAEASIYIHVSRLAMLSTLIQPIWEGLVMHRWQSDQVLQLRRQLAAIDLVADAERIGPAQALLQMDMWDELNETFRWQNLIRHRKALLSQHDGAQFWIGLVWQFHPKGWSYQNKVDAYRWFNQLEAKDRQDFKPVDPLSALFVLPKLKSISRDLEAGLTTFQLVIQMAATACALEQHYLAEGAYPDSLSQIDLNPAEQRTIQTDTGPTSLLYRRISEHEFLLHPDSLAQPEVQFPAADHPSLQSFSGDQWDYVWRQNSRRTEN